MQLLKSQNEERKGIILALIAAGMFGALPILINRGGQNIPPILFAALTSLVAGLYCFFHAFIKGRIGELKKTSTWPSLLIITIFIVVLPNALYFIGAPKTSGINATMLLLSEMIFTLFFTPFIGEKNTLTKLLGALGILIGGIFLIYKGNFSLNSGDLLIILSTSTYPIGNFYTKKLFNDLSAEVILFVRFFLGGISIFIISLLLESPSDIWGKALENWQIILFIGIIIFSLRTLIWYEGFKRLDISKAISLVMTFPLFSLLLLIIFFGEIPSLLQLSGIILMLIGLYFSIKRPSTNPQETRYGVVT